MCSYYFHPFAPFATSDVHVLTVFSPHIACILYFHVTDPRVFLPRFLFPLILVFIVFLHICLIYWHTRHSSRRRNRCKRLGGPSGRGLAFALTLFTLEPNHIIFELNRYDGEPLAGVGHGVVILNVRV